MVPPRFSAALAPSIIQKDHQYDLEDK